MVQNLWCVKRHTHPTTETDMVAETLKERIIKNDEQIKERDKREGERELISNHFQEQR